MATRLDSPKPNGSRLLGWIRARLLTGILVLAPSAITIWVLFRLLNWVDNLLGRYFRFEFFDYNRIPGLGLVATALLLLLVGAVAAWIGSGPIVRLWDRALLRIPGVGIVYGSTKSLGEALLNQKEQAFKQVVLVPWPHDGVWRVGFITGRAGAEVRDKVGVDVEVVFVPHTPNPASGFVQYVPRKDIVYLDWQIEDGVRVIVSGGVVQPDMELVTARSARSAAPAMNRAPAAEDAAPSTSFPEPAQGAPSG